MRGIFKEEYDLDPADVHWRSGGVEQPERKDAAITHLQQPQATFSYLQLPSATSRPTPRPPTPLRSITHLKDFPLRAEGSALRFRTAAMPWLAVLARNRIGLVRLARGRTLEDLFPHSVAWHWPHSRGSAHAISWRHRLVACEIEYDSCILAVGHRTLRRSPI